MLDVFGLFSVDTLYVLLGMAVIIIVLLIILIVNCCNIKKMKNKYEIFMKGKDAKSLEEVFEKRFTEIDTLKSDSKKYRSEIKKINEELLSTYQKMGMVKYDAFNEMGGKLSFALAMLDKSNNGYVINAMHSREGCYTYIKEIVNGESYIDLGEEEKKALNSAINGDKPDSE